ncbi:MAG: hypothetical protein ACLR9W_05415 [Enterobacter hormaechei]
MTAGSAVWGQIAAVQPPASLVVATLGMVLASMTVFAGSWKIRFKSRPERQPLDGVIELPNERGPVLVSQVHHRPAERESVFAGRASYAGCRAAPGR